ncbi:hypothetical protein [Glycomyces dulcitolivorans]|uniref:hypothetical protein n=1 Tax=Glycomyces dulcitolivorans TaxID=2200759 RepID=UPI001300A9CC|nr:hypothetical protein [Glycomyces dulcitolivorans]
MNGRVIGAFIGALAVAAATVATAGGASAQDAPQEPECVAIARGAALKYEYGDAWSETDDDGNVKTETVSGFVPVGFWPIGTCFTAAALSHYPDQYSGPVRGFDPDPAFDPGEENPCEEHACSNSSFSGWVYPTPSNRPNEHKQFIQMTAADGTRAWTDKLDLTAYDRDAFRPWTLDIRGGWLQYDPGPPPGRVCAATAPKDSRVYREDRNRFDYWFLLRADECYSVVEDARSGTWEPAGYNGEDWVQTWIGGTQKCFVRVDVGWMDVGDLSFGSADNPCTE